MEPTERYSQALEMARRIHHGDTRKGSGTPYLAHLLSVSALVMEAGGTEDQAIAALLHDAAEDHGGHATVAEIRAAFGDDVADLVVACSDSLAADPADKEPWWERKTAYLHRLATETLDAVLISAADKVHNARSVLADYRAVGEELWSRFNADAGRAGELWYYTRLVEVICDRLIGTPAAHLAVELQTTVDAIRTEVAAAGADVDAEVAEGRRRERAILDA